MLHVAMGDQHKFSVDAHISHSHYIRDCLCQKRSIDVKTTLSCFRVDTCPFYVDVVSKIQLFFPYLLWLKEEKNLKKNVGYKVSLIINET